MDDERIKILLVDDHTMLRKGMALLLSEQADITIVGETGDSKEALELVRLLKPDIVIIEVSMPQLSGIEAAQQIIADSPHCKVIAFTTHSDKHSVDDMLAAGATAYLLKESAPEELLKGIHAAMRGEIFLSHAITGTVLEAYVEKISGKHLQSRLKEDIGILRTKLHSPPVMSDMVTRPRLNERLNAGRVKPLILVSAPAGYGKSLLISSWLRTCEWPGAWVSLDQSESDLRQFMLYCLASIDDLFPNACEQTLSMVNAPQLPSITILVASLSNELEKIEQPFFLVLDDYYRINTRSPVHDLIYHLLEYPPLALHLVIITRRDPPIQLISLRAKEQVAELRMQDLCFTRDEAKLLLEQAAAYTANEDTLDNLQREIEGWVVGLRMVSQVLRSNNNQENFLQNLKGGVQQTNMYLLHEVFTRQTSKMQEYMLKSSILNRFCVPLCEAVRQSTSDKSEFSARKFIDGLTEGNLFVIPLDAHGEWFRFHHLFQQLLQNELTHYMSSDEIAELHIRAGQWFAEHDLIDEAIEHLLAAGDDTGAAEIVEKQYWSVEQDKYGWRDIERWLTALPAGTKGQRPKLLISQAWVANIRFQLNEITPIVQKLELMDRENHLDEICLGGLKHFQGVLHYWAGRGEIALKLFLETKELIPDKYSGIFGSNEFHIAMASNMSNQLTFALSLCNKTIKHHDRDNIILSSRLFLARSFLHLFLGNMNAVMQDAKRMNNLLIQSDPILVQGWGEYMQASVCFRQNNLPVAREHFSFLINNKYAVNTRVAIDSIIGLALTCQSMQQDAAATDTIEILLKFAEDTGQAEHLHAAQSGQARLALAQGNLNLATEWLNSYDEPFIAPSMFFWLENPAITRARVMLAIGSPESLQRTSKLLTFLQQEMGALHNTSQMIEIMVLRSIALDMTGNTEAALNVLEQVIVLAEPGGWIRPFIELGQPMAKLLDRLKHQTVCTDHANLILDNFKETKVQPNNIISSRTRANSNSTALTAEALTNRELDILELLVQRMQNKEMAARLFVSSETIKTHLKHLYQKLGVNNRRDAAVIASDILSPQITAVIKK